MGKRLRHVSSAVGPLESTGLTDLNHLAMKGKGEQGVR